MYGRSGRWGAFLIVVLFAAAVGYGAYSLGVSQGLAMNPPVAATAAPAVPGGAPAVVYPYGWYPYGWHRPWGFGFFPIIFFIFFWMIVSRALFWGRWRRGCYGYGPDGHSLGFDDWHRRAHERMNANPRPDGPTQQL